MDTSPTRLWHCSSTETITELMSRHRIDEHGVDIPLSIVPSSNVHSGTPTPVPTQPARTRAFLRFARFVLLARRFRALVPCLCQPCRSRRIGVSTRPAYVVDPERLRGSDHPELAAACGHEVLCRRIHVQPGRHRCPSLTTEAEQLRSGTVTRL